MKRVLVITLAALCLGALAMDLTLTDEETAQCGREGGCVVVSKAMLQGLVNRAHQAGLDTCKNSV